MTGFVCSVCGQIHDELPLDIAYIRPADYFKIPESEREQRVKCTNDYCVIDGSEFYIRGILTVPVIDLADEFCFGLWARIGKRDFDRYLELWDTDPSEDEPSFIGYLSGGTTAYPTSDQIAVMVHLQTKNQRPRFYVVQDEHPLSVDQRSGVDMNKVHQFWELVGIKP